MGIKIYDIERAEYAEEKVCAEGSMRFMYGNPVGRAATSLVFKRAFFSRMCGAWADSRASLKSAEKFARENGINMDESLLPFSAFKTFNDFFTRELKASARPVGGGAKTVSFPSDGLGGYTIDQRDDTYVVFNEKGDIVLLPDELVPVSLGDLITVRDKESGLFGFADYNGNCIISPQYEDVSTHLNGFASFLQDW